MVLFRISKVGFWIYFDLGGIPDFVSGVKSKLSKFKNSEIEHQNSEMIYLYICSANAKGLNIYRCQ
jgi:hypothetical protein